MTIEEFEKLLKAKKIEYTKNEAGQYITKNYGLRFENGDVVYFTDNREYKFDVDKELSGFLNMRWEECEYAKAFAVYGFIHPHRHQDAYEYLHEDNMAQYLWPNDDPLGIIEDIRWDLTREQSGLIIVKSRASWPRWYFSLMNNFTDGQNSDGLGESFEQQDFISMNRNGTWTLHSEESNWFKY